MLEGVLREAGAGMVGCDGVTTVFNTIERILL